MTTTISPNREKKNAKKTAALAAAEQVRLINRIRNLFELEGWSTEAISEAVKLSRSEVIRLIQHGKRSEAGGMLPLACLCVFER